MSITNHARRQLQDRLDNALGPEAAGTLMDELASLRDEQSGLRQAVDLGFARVARDLAALRAELKTDMAELRTDFAELRSAVSDRLEQQTRQLLFAMIGAMATIAAMAFGAARLI